MKSDLEILAELEKSIGVRLGVMDPDEQSSRTTIGYAVDHSKRVTILVIALEKLKDFPAEILQLQNLQTLDLAINQLSSLPAAIAQLQSLQTLTLSYNQFSSLPAAIAQLQSLQTLDLSHNQLSDLPAAIAQLQSLQTLDLSHNQLSSLPAEITKLNMDFGLRFRPGFVILKNNPLKSPPLEVVKQGRKAVIAYFESLVAEAKTPLNEVKILLVGDGAVGKTSLVKRLVHQTFDPQESQTHGINIHDWLVQDKGREIVAHFWDFGGQEIMHATHQFFLSKRSVYVLVLDGRKDEKAEYWLKTIESFGGDSPVLVVLNKVDENPGFDVNRRFLQEKYPGIVGFFKVSCAKRTGLTPFRRALEKTLGEVEILQTVWPRSWFEVKKNLEAMSTPFINFSEYTDLCDDKGVADQTRQDTLIGFLADLGVIVHFPDFDLRDVYVLEPKWVTEGVYKIINSEELARAKGILNLRRLSKILDPAIYSSDKQRYLVALMRKFELCYALDRDQILVPDLLEVQEPDFDLGDENPLRFRIDYGFLPRSVIPRFIVKMHKDIHQDETLQGLVWRTGVVLRSEAFDSTAVVKADYEAGKIHIQVSGPRRRDYFAAVLFFLREINGSFEKLDLTERVPLPDNPSVAVGYENLLLQDQAGFREIIPDGGTRRYNVRELLGLVQDETTSDERILEVQREILDKMDSAQKPQLTEFVELKPNFMGIGLNLNAVIEWLQRFIGKSGRH